MGGDVSEECGPTVLVDWIAKDFKLKDRLLNEVEAFSLVEDYLLLCFGLEE